jgi:polyisoprenoid-binding protein YceI
MPRARLSGAQVAAQKTPQKRIVQSISSEQSVLRFALDSPLVQLRGRFTQVRGSLALDANSLEPQQVRLQMSPNDIEFDGATAPAPLLQSAGSSPLQFSSSAIRPQGNNRYLVQGKGAWGGQVFDMQFQVLARQKTSTKSRCDFSISGPIASVESLGLLGAGGSSGKLAGSLVFQAAEQ